MYKGGSIRNSTIVYNSHALEGGGVYAQEEGTIYNSIVYFNQRDNFEIDGTGIYVRSSCSRWILPAYGNITNAPLFVNSENDVFQHSPRSPCIDAGSNALTNDTGDIDGTDRVIYTVDMGCYEFIPEHQSSALHYYVSPGGNNQYPYTTPEWAAHNIQDAINTAQAGDTVHVGLSPMTLMGKSPKPPWFGCCL